MARFFSAPQGGGFLNDLCWLFRRIIPKRNPEQYVWSATTYLEQQDFPFVYPKLVRRLKRYKLVLSQIKSSKNLVQDSLKANY